VAATPKSELPGVFYHPIGLAERSWSKPEAPSYFCVPPYDRLTQCASPRELRELPRGSIVLVGGRVPADVRFIAAAAPGALIVVGIPAGETIRFTEFEELRWAGVSAVVTTDPRAANAPMVVAAARTASESLRGQLGPRLRLLGHPVPPPCEAAVERLVEGAFPWSARDWAGALGKSVRALERSCAEHWHVPTPRRWIELVQVISAAQAVQAQRNQSVEWALTAAGFTNVRNARELMKKVGRTTPGQARALIGWYWVVEAWCQGFWQGLPVR
jgi:hypothetical protein